MARLPPLDEVLEYTNVNVVDRFKENHPKDAYRAEQLFTEMLRYLWLCEKHSWDTQNNPKDRALAFVPVMHEEMRAMDNMWHEFILLTREYADFCHKHFGRFLHHEPNMRRQLAYLETEFVESLQLFLQYIYEVLGEETVRLWFQDHLQEVA